MFLQRTAGQRDASTLRQPRREVLAVHSGLSSESPQLLQNDAMFLWKYAIVHSTRGFGGWMFGEGRRAPKGDS